MCKLPLLFASKIQFCKMLFNSNHLLFYFLFQNRFRETRIAASKGVVVRFPYKLALRRSLVNQAPFPRNSKYAPSSLPTDLESQRYAPFRFPIMSNY